MAYGPRLHRPIRYRLTDRLFRIVAFLGLLPMVGATVALLTVQSGVHDSAALDRIARSTIRLERINGLVYAAVRDSRGIYMSPDWPSAEPYAGDLTADLARLQNAAQNWQPEALLELPASADRLAAQIGQFVRLRGQLVGLAGDSGIAAARQRGDDGASREATTALTHTLATLSQAYQREFDRAHDRIAQNDRDFMLSLAGLSVVALIALCAALFLIRTGLLSPLLRVRDSMLGLARGDLDSAVDEGGCAAEIAEMNEAIGVFRTTLIERQQHNLETQLLSELNEWLQSCNSLSELYDMIAAFVARLMPECAGSLYIYANSRDVLESVKAWNGGRITAAMHPEDCWSLRRGRPYTFGENEIDFPCPHVGAQDAGDYCCIPILAHGETVGLLHLEFAAAGDDETAPAAHRPIAEQRRMGLVCAEQISLAIANVKLRDQLRDQSIRDVVTGLFNRRYMLETARREFARAARAGQSVSLLSIDVDYFKKFNDNHGHDAGDTVLRAVAGCLQTTFRNEDVPCRFGGEEFVVLLPGANIEIGAMRAEQLRAKVEALVVRYLEDNLPRVTISIGVAAYPAAGETPNEALKTADEALYRAKQNGRNRVEIAGMVGAAPPRTAPAKRPSADVIPLSDTAEAAAANLRVGAS